MSILLLCFVSLICIGGPPFGAYAVCKLVEHTTDVSGGERRAFFIFSLIGIYSVTIPLMVISFNLPK